MPLFTSELSYGDDYPTIEPSLKLDFANARALDPRITFTRASTATYVGRDGLIKTAGEDEARFDHDPETLESLGLLIEESRTNIFDQSEDVETWSSVFWTKTNNVAISPDGTQTAGSLVPNVGTTTQSSGRTVTQSAGNHVCSVFAKPNGLTVLKIRFSGSSYQATFNLTGNGSVTSQNNGTASISKRPDGWYRCVFVINDSVGETAQWQLGHNDNSNVDGTNGFYIWGMQVEAGTFQTSYIPTSGSTATRAVDDAVIQGDSFNSFFNPSEGSIICKYKKDHWPVASGNIGYERVWEIGDGTDPNNLNIFNDPTQSSGNNIRYRVRTNLTNVFGPTTITTGTNQTPTVALGYAKDNFVLVIDGTLVAADTSGDLPVVDRLHIGGRYGNDSTDRFNNTISKLFYYPKRITVAQLQTLTQ